MRTPEEKEKYIKEVLSEPFLDGFSDNLLRIRRNLLIFSTLALGIQLSNLEIVNGNILGLEIEGVDTYLVIQILFWLIFYHFAHFWYQSYDYLKKWRLRLTASAFANRAIKHDHNEDYADFPHQSTLYNWWQGVRHMVNSPSEIISEINCTVAEISELSNVISSEEHDVPNRSQAAIKINALSSKTEAQVHKFERTISDIKKIVESERIQLSLKNYDRWFLNFQWQQLVRLFLMEFGLPAGLGIWALFATSPFPTLQTVAILFIICLSLPLLSFVLKLCLLQLNSEPSSPPDVR